MDDKDQVNSTFMNNTTSNLSTINLLNRFIFHTALYNNNKRSEQYRNPFNNYGKKTYSQTDEDGLTFEIVRRLGLRKGVFAEFGVGDGRENNTLALAALKWRGFWVGNEDLIFDTNPAKVEKPNFTYQKSFITRENLVTLLQDGLRSISRQQIDLISLDLDGNDIYFVEDILKSGVNPKLFIVEYNSKFIPPIEWQIAYDADHRWRNDDYYGASLMAFANMFEKYGYFVVCCNSFSGSNAFFVRKEFRALFPDVPDDIDRIWCPPMFFLPADYGHSSSLTAIEKIFADLQADTD